MGGSGCAGGPAGSRGQEAGQRPGAAEGAVWPVLCWGKRSGTAWSDRPKVRAPEVSEKEGGREEGGGQERRPEGGQDMDPRRPGPGWTR